jgi:hypothetical protein
MAVRSPTVRRMKPLGRETILGDGEVAGAAVGRAEGGGLPAKIASFCKTPTETIAAAMDVNPYRI